MTNTNYMKNPFLEKEPLLYKLISDQNSFFYILKKDPDNLEAKKEYKKIKSEIDTIISTCNHVDVNDVSALSYDEKAENHFCSICQEYI